MKSISLVLMICAIVLTSCGRNESDNPEQKWQAAKDSAGVTLNITQALQDWKKDTVGCLRLRDEAMIKGLFKVVKLDNIPQDSVIQMLGQPNLIRPRAISLNGKEVNVIVLTYYTESMCTAQNQFEDRLSWLNISILVDTNRVVDVMGGIT
jgi:hypothetical protein